MRLGFAIAALAVGALAPGHAAAQADNSNALIEPDGARSVVLVADATRALPRWLRDEPRRRDRAHAFAEGLTAAELGLLYGSEFATGANADWPALPAP